MREAIWFVVLAGCSSAPADHKLPTATRTPFLDVAHPWTPCASASTFAHDTTPDITYRYTYDASHMLAHLDGEIVVNSTSFAADYTWTSDGRLLHKLYTLAGQPNTETTAQYDPVNGLTQYTWDATMSATPMKLTLTYSSFLAPDEPSHLASVQEDGTGSELGQDQLAYDADGRLVLDTPESGPATAYTYDDQAHTITANTGAGSMIEITTYDADGRKLSDVWNGTDPAALHDATLYMWSGDQLMQQTFSSLHADTGTMQIDEVDTYRYNCP